MTLVCLCIAVIVDAVSGQCYVNIIHVFVVLQKVVRNQSHIKPIAEELSQRFIVDGHVIKDKVDVIFLSRIIEGFSRNIANNDKVASVCIICMQYEYI